MAVPKFPTIRLPSGLEEELENPAIRSEMESGIIISRPRYTRLRKIFTLEWQNLNGTDYRTLKSFFIARLGGGEAFTWTHPKEGITFTVRFNGDSFRAKHTEMDFWNLSIRLEQV